MNITRNKNHQFQSLNFGRTILEDTHSHKHLGIIFENNCKWESHIKTLTAKCRCQVDCLRSFKYRLSRNSLQTMSRSFILPQSWGRPQPGRGRKPEILTKLSLPSRINKYRLKNSQLKYSRPEDMGKLRNERNSTKLHKTTKFQQHLGIIKRINDKKIRLS